MVSWNIFILHTSVPEYAWRADKRLNLTNFNIKKKKKKKKRRKGKKKLSTYILCSEASSRKKEKIFKIIRQNMRKCNRNRLSRNVNANIFISFHCSIHRIWRWRFKFLQKATWQIKNNKRNNIIAIILITGHGLGLSSCFRCTHNVFFSFFRFVSRCFFSFIFY